MEGQVDGSVKSRRTAELREISDRMEEARAKSFVGKTVEVLAERVLENGSFEGYCREYIRVTATSDEQVEPGDILTGTVDSSSGFDVSGSAFTKQAGSN